MAGSTGILKDIEFTTDRGTYDTAKNGWYNGSGERTLNWMYVYSTDSEGRLLYKISAYGQALLLKSKTFIDSGADYTIPTSGTAYIYPNFDPPIVNTLGEWVGGANSRYTVKVSSWYQIDFSIGSTTYLNSATLSFKKNGVTIDYRTGPNIAFNYSDSIYLEAGDYLEIFVEVDVTPGYFGGHYFRIFMYL